MNDARSFLRTTDKTYDMIIYGLLDSHTLLSYASSVRLDSFVYTVEGLREVRAPFEGRWCSFFIFFHINDALARKIYRIMQQTFDGRPPVCVRQATMVP